MALLLLLPLIFGVLNLPPSTARPSPKAPNGTAGQTQVTLAVVLPEGNLSYPWAWPRVRPALCLALEVLQPDLQKAGLSIHPVFTSSSLNGSCSGDLVLKEVVKLKISQDPDVLLGGGCNMQNDLIGTWAHTKWNLLLLSAGYYFPRPRFTTTVHARPLWSELSNFLPLLHQHFNWSSHTVFALSPPQDDSQFDLELLADWQQLMESFSPATAVYFKPEQAVEFIRAYGQVVYMFGSLEMLQQVMRLAQAENMTNGDYVFFYVDILEESLKAEGHREAAKPWQSKEGQDGGSLREAFRTVLVITSHSLQTPEYRRFHSQVLLRAQKDHGVELGDSLRKNMLAAYYHDVLLLYIRALNETLHEGGTKRDTSRILEKMKDLKIQGVTGTVSINSENIREMDFAIWTLTDVESGEYQVVGRYMASEKQIKWLVPIHWWPPLNNLSYVRSSTHTPWLMLVVPTFRAGAPSMRMLQQHPGSAQDLVTSWSGELIYCQAAILRLRKSICQKTVDLLQQNRWTF